MVYGVSCLMSLSTIFQLYHGGLFLLVEETGVPGENHPPVASHWQSLWHNVVSINTGYELTALAVIGKM
jgi:hypothetical protein